MLKKLFFFVLCLQSIFGNDTNPNPLLLSEIQPNTIVNGVHVVTGQYIIDEVDYIIPGPEPLVIRRSLTSASEKEGFYIFSQYDAYYRHNHPKPFVCTDQDGYVFEFANKSTQMYNTDIAPGIHIGHMSGNTITINGQDPNKNLFVLDNQAYFPNLTNLGHAQISGRTNFRNHHIRTKNDSSHIQQEHVRSSGDLFYMVKGNGTKLYYQESINDFPNQHFKLNREVFPNGNYRKYVYDTRNEKENLKAIETYNTKGELLNWVKVYYGHSQNCPSKIETSDGKVLEYSSAHFDNANYKTYNIPDKYTYQYEYASICHMEENGRFLNRVSTPCHTATWIQYHEPVKQPNYYGIRFGSKYVSDHQTGKVRSCTQQGLNAKFEYEKDKTIVTQAGKRIEFIYSESANRMREIRHFKKDGTLHYIEHYHWGEGRDSSNLISKTLSVPNFGTVTTTVFQYDFYGNVLEERIYGNITGKTNAPIQINNKGIPTNPNAEYQSKKASYTNNKVDLLNYHNEDYNLPLVEKDARKTLTYTYKKGTDLVESILLWNQNTIKRREFCFYDDSCGLVKKIIDDGNTPDETNLSGVTSRQITMIYPRKKQPALSAPEKIEHKFLNLETKQEELLNTEFFTYDNMHNLVEHTLTTPNNLKQIKRFEYNAYHQKTKEIDPAGRCTSYTYDRDGRLVETLFHNGNRLLNSYDHNDHLIEQALITNTETQIKRYKYNDRHQILSETDENGNETNYEYDFDNHPTKIIQKEVLNEKDQKVRPTTIQEFDALGNCVFKQDPNGDITQTTYNIFGQPTHIYYPDNTRRTCTYTLDGLLEKEILPTGAIVEYEYDYQSRLTKETTTDPKTKESRLKSYRYNAFHLLEETDELGQTTTYTYDDANRLQSKTKHEKITHYTYDNLNRIIKESVFSLDLLEYTIEYTYDNLNRTTQKAVYLPTGELQLIKNFTYDQDDNLIETSYHDQYPIYKKYDTLHRLIEKTDAEGHTTTFAYTKTQNALNQTVDQYITTDPKQRQHIKTFDALGHIVEETCFLTSECLSKKAYTYDQNGNLVDQIETVFSPRGPPKKFIVSNLYAPGNKLIQQTQAKHSFNEKITRYNYNKQGLLFQIIKPNKITLSYTYNAFGEKIQQQSSDTSIFYTYCYDKCGHLIAVFDKEKCINKRTYTNNILIEETFANNLTLSKTIDSQKRPTHIHLPDHSTIETSYKGLFTDTVTRNNYAFTFAYSPSARLESYTLPNNQSITFSYSNAGYLNKIQAPHYIESLTHDSTHLITNTHIQDAFSTHTHQFTYDALDQLSSESGLQHHTYTHDSLHNRLSCDTHNFTLNELNQIITTSDATELTYDANGNLTSKKTPQSTTTYTYDALDRLTSIQTPSQTITFTYDHTFRRLSQTTQTTDTTQTLYFLYDQNDEIAAFDENNTLTEFKLLHEDHILAIELNHTPYITYQNAQGSIAAFTTLDGKLIQSYRYSAFGQCTPMTQNLTSPWTYQSKRQVLDLYAFGYRDYDPTLGRFLTPDPLGFIDSLNLYTFVQNSPISFIDPYGLRESFYDRLRSDYDRTRDPLRDSPIGLGATSSRERQERYRRGQIRSSLHGVESALRGSSANQMISAAQTAVNTTHASYQISVAGVYGLSEELERNIDAATGIAEIILGLEMMGGGGGITIGTFGTGAFVGAPMMAAGAVMTLDGFRRLIRPLIAKNTRGFNNVLYNKRSSSGSVDFDKLAEAGKAHDRGGLTKAGRGLAKHGGRKGSHFPKPKGNPSKINKQGQKLLEKILRDPNKKVKEDFFRKYGEIIDIETPKFGGVRYTKDGRFIGFLELK